MQCCQLLNDVNHGPTTASAAGAKPTLGGSGGMPPPENFALLKSISCVFMQNLQVVKRKKYEGKPNNQSNVDPNLFFKNNLLSNNCCPI